MPAGTADKVPQVKGVSMLNAVRALRALGKAKAYELLPEHLHKYLGAERIVTVAWYPEADMLELNRAVAQILRPTLGSASLEDTFVHMGRLVGRADLSGIYASRIRARPLDQATERLSPLWKQYHDTGSLEVTSQSNGARFELRDYGMPSRELCWIQRGWFLAFLELVGATNYEVVESQCRNRGAASCVWQASWR